MSIAVRTERESFDPLIRKYQTRQRGAECRRGRLLAEAKNADGAHKGRCRWCDDRLVGRRTTYCSGGVNLPSVFHIQQAFGAGKAMSLDGWGCRDEWWLRSVGSFARKVVFLRDRGICRSCGTDCSAANRTWHVDHVIPIYRGGRGGLENLQTLCECCHKSKTNADRLAAA